MEFMPHLKCLIICTWFLFQLAFELKMAVTLFGCARLKGRVMLTVCNYYCIHIIGTTFS